MNKPINNDLGYINNVDRCWHPPVFQWCGTCQLHCQPAGWVSWYPQWSQEACWAPCLWPGTTSEGERERQRDGDKGKEKWIYRDTFKNTENPICSVMSVPGKWDWEAESCTPCLPTGRNARHRWSFHTRRSSVSPRCRRDIELFKMHTEIVFFFF